MLDFSWSEIALIGVVALVVIGPKDLPKALRTVGVWVRKARTISREFQSSVEQMIRESELDEVRKQVESVTSIDVTREIEKSVDPTGEIAESLKAPEVPDFDKLASGNASPAEAQADAAASPTAAPEPQDLPSIEAPEPADPAVPKPASVAGAGATPAKPENPS